MRSLLVTLWACLSLAITIVPTTRAAAQDAPDKPKPPRRTWHDAYAALLEFNRRTLVGTYDKVGKRDPKWDDARRGAAGGHGAEFHQRGRPRVLLARNAQDPGGATGTRAHGGGCRLRRPAGAVVLRDPAAAGGAGEANRTAPPGAGGAEGGRLSAERVYPARAGCWASLPTRPSAMRPPTHSTNTA